MGKVSYDEIREKFLGFFEKNNHLKIQGASIVPKNDPTLLFINAGMAPLKKYFTGEEKPPKKNLCNIQPCIRTIDIDDVGDRYHATSFEMLGSWSIDNYFKKDAIRLAYDLLINELKIPKEKLYATVFEGDVENSMPADDESAKYWEEVGFSNDHIVYCPKEDNFWGPTAQTGPCGPCTEVFYDAGDAYGKSYHETGIFNTSRYIEIWNAGVFMEFYKDASGKFENLKFKSVDTGAGIERLEMTLNGHESIYDTDLIRPIMDEVNAKAKRLGKDLSLRDKRIITDHIKTSTFIISEDIVPSNEGRGYIPRKLIRKCIGIVTKNKLYDYSLNSIVEVVIEGYGKYYPKMIKNKEKILSIIEKEYEGFKTVLREGFSRMEKITGEKGFVINGKEAFLLFTTYGIPIELIEEFAVENGGSVDREAFEKEFEQHREISKKSKETSSGSNILEGIIRNGADSSWMQVRQTQFLGYDDLNCEAKVLALLDKDGKALRDSNGNDEVVMVFDKTPMYAESGGQISDSGTIRGDGLIASVRDVKKTDNNVYIHLCKVEEGEVLDGADVSVMVDEKKRKDIMRHHTSVHLLQSALRSIVSDSIKQAGSLVEEDRLRFDFGCERKLSEEEIIKIEAKVNDYIMQNLTLEIKQMDMNEAINAGALALFEEKYTDKVRVVSVPGVSKELCGGTHVRATGDIGSFKILSEASVGRGVRRITGISGIKALEYIQSQVKVIDELSLKLKVSSSDLVDKVDLILKASKEKTKSSSEDNNNVCMSKDEISSKMRKSKKGMNYICQSFDFFSNALRDEAVRVSEIIDGVVCFIGTEDKGVKVVVAVNKPRAKTNNANPIIKGILEQLGGKGGGRDYLALGGGSKKEMVDEVVNRFEELALI